MRACAALVLAPRLVADCGRRQITTMPHKAIRVIESSEFNVAARNAAEEQEWLTKTQRRVRFVHVTDCCAREHTRTRTQTHAVSLSLGLSVSVGVSRFPSSLVFRGAHVGCWCLRFSSFRLSYCRRTETRSSPRLRRVRTALAMPPSSAPHLAFACATAAMRQAEYIAQHNDLSVELLRQLRRACVSLRACVCVRAHLSARPP